MNDNNRSSGFSGLADRTAAETDEALRDEEVKLLLETNVDLESLRPQITDQATYDQLIAAVAEVTSQNNDVAMLKVRISALGQAGWDLVKKIKPFI